MSRKRKKPQAAKPVQFAAATAALAPEVADWLTDPEYNGAAADALVNPDWIPRENSAADVRIYEALYRDGEVRTGLAKRTASLLSEQFEIVSGGKDQRDLDVAAALKPLFAGNFRMAQKEAIEWALLCGYSVQEVLGGVTGEQWALTNWLAKKPWRFKFMPDRSLRLLTKAAPQNGVAVPENVFVTLTWGSTDNNYGRGLGQALWRPVRCKLLIEKLWTLYLDKYSMPGAVGWYSPTGDAKKDKKQEQAILQAGAAIRNSIALALPEGVRLELLESSRSGKAEYLEALEYFDKQIRIIIQSQTLNTDVGSTGSYAAVDGHSAVAWIDKESDALIHAAAMEQAIKILVAQNFAGYEKTPVFRWITEKESVQKELAETYEKLNAMLIQGGQQLDPVFLADKFNVRTVPATAAAPEAQFSAPRTAQTLLDEHAEKLISAADLSKNTQSFSDIVQKSESYENALKAVLDYYPEMNMDSLQGALETGLLNGRLLGKTAVQRAKAKAGAK
jgi:phage gp29-like protein